MNPEEARCGEIPDPIDDCEDRYDDCKHWADEGGCGKCPYKGMNKRKKCKWYRFVKKNCPISCQRTDCINPLLRMQPYW